MRYALVVVVFLTAAACGGGTNAAPLPLRKIEDVALPGTTGRFDYVTLDSSRHLLAVAHLSDSTVLGFDTAAMRVIWEARGVSSVHGVRVAPELGRVFASATGTNEVVAIDETTGALIARAPTGGFPDGLAYDPSARTVFVSNKDGGTETVVDAHTFAAIGDVAVGHDVGNVQYDDANRAMLVAVGSTDELVTVDVSSRRVLRRTRLPGCQGAHGVAIDPATGHVFVACEDNARVVNVDLKTGTVTATLATGRTPDVLALDTGLGRLYVASESGVVSAYSTGGGSLSALGTAHIANGAHTVAVDPVSHLVYLPLPDVAGHPVLRVLSPS